MKIAIISDTHDNHAAIVWIIEYLNDKNIKVAFHAGDIVVPGMVQKFIQHFEGHLHYVFGNNDGEQAKHMEVAQQNSDKVTLYLWEGMHLELDGKKIFMNHYSGISELVAKSGEYDVCIGGHDHRYRVIEHGKSLFINPGNTLVQNKWQGKDSPDIESSFVILDLKTMEHERILLPTEI